ncbi:MAG: hypothetical protein JXR48_16050 [Candidatus Delongbacteria bacterium]|nr:hypothetical protein [Candidatus Delongbacteria bacterium]MBN2836471.1 hypothetical protein [Candidatus Delongbacteria bacterium]
MKSFSNVILFIISLIVVSCSDLENVSPFYSMKWIDGDLHVQIDQDEKELFTVVEIEKVSFNKICNELKSNSYSWKYDLIEDFVKTLRNLGLEITKELTVKLKTTTGAIVEKEVILSKSKWINNTLEIHDYPIDEYTSANPNNAYDFLKLEPLKEATSIKRNKSALSSVISKQVAVDYIDRLQGIIENNFSYKERFNGSYLEALSVLRNSIGDSIFISDLESKVSKFIALFGDGHAGYIFSNGRYNNLYLPFLINKINGEYIAFNNDRDSFLEPEYPIIEKIDGVDINKWIEVAKLYIPRGSNQYISINEVKKLREINQLRLELNLPLEDRVCLELSSLDRSSSKKIQLDLIESKPQYGTGYDNVSKILDSNIGYLRIKKMEKTSDDIIKQMDNFRSTDALIIDVRGNGGGNRKIIVDLLPYFLDENEFYVSNLAKYCIQPYDEKNVKEGYLEDRFMYPISSDKFNEFEKNELKQFINTFEPVWVPNDEKFSEWHFMVHRKKDNPLSYKYDKEVIILMDSNCFSATDVLLNAFKGRKNVTMIGAPSGGGSGRSYIYFFPSDPINLLRLSTMISYKTNGELIEGNGIYPDIFKEESITDFTGKSDSILDAAIEVIKKGQTLNTRE